MLALLKQILQMFSGTTSSIIVKIVGMFSFRLFALWIERLIKKQEKKQRDEGLQGNISDINQNGADAVANLEASIRLNDELLAQKDRENREKLKAMLEPKLTVDGPLIAKKAFVVKTENIDAGLPIFADRKWRVGTTPSSGQTLILLTSPGKRTLDIEIKPDNWFSVDIEVV